MRRIFVLCASVLILVLALLACGESSNNTGTVASPTNTHPTATATSASSQHFKVGQVVKVADTWQMSILSAKTSSGSQYIKPKAGNVYLILTVSMKNISSQEQNVSSLLQFHLQDSSGQQYNATIDPDAGASIDGKVEAGSPRKGVLVYEVPQSTHDYTLGFENDIASQGQVLWDIHI